MDEKIENIRTELDELSEDVKRILDSKISEPEIKGIKKYLDQLLSQSETYYRNLKDKGMNSRSEVSRRMAMSLLSEERWSVNPLYNKEGFPSDIKREDISSVDLDIEALYVEYLTGRARQALRDAEMGALYLKLLSGKINSASTITNNIAN